MADEIVTPPVGGRYPSSRWSAREIVRDQYTFWLSGDFVPGAYQLLVGLGDGQGATSLGVIRAVAP